MASVLLMSKQGDGVPLLIRMAQQGHVCKTYVQDRRAKKSLRNFRNPSVIGQPKMLEQYDLIIYDMAGLGEQADSMKEQGLFILGGGKLNDSLELDRSYGEKVARSLLKVQVPEGKLVRSEQDAVSFLEGAGKAMVLKPLDNKLPSLTLVSKDKENTTLLSLVQVHSRELLPGIFQERIDGIEISTEGWFNGEEFVCFNHTVEKKRLMEGDKGPQTGCMGNVVWVCARDRLVEDCLLPMQPLLQKARYLGPLDVNCICTETEAYFLEFTPRIGYDAIQALSELMRTDLFEFMWQIASKGDNIKLRDDYGIAVRLTMPPYPSKDYQALDLLDGTRVVDVPREAMKHTFLSDVARRDGKLVMAGVDGVVGCTTARSNTVHEARRRAYRTIRNISLTDDLQYRKDIGLDVEDKVGKLKQWGWLDA